MNFFSHFLSSFCASNSFLALSFWGKFRLGLDLQLYVFSVLHHCVPWRGTGDYSASIPFSVCIQFNLHWYTVQSQSSIIYRDVPHVWLSFEFFSKPSCPYSCSVEEEANFCLLIFWSVHSLKWKKKPDRMSTLRVTLETKYFPKNVP